MKYLTILLFIVSLSTNAQTIEGFVYDHESTVKGAKLINTTQNILTYSDAKGQFKIEAKLNDKLVINSYFHSQQTIIITKKYFEKDIVIELQKITNELDVVEVTKIVEKEFDSIVLKTEIRNQIVNDIKNRPYLYGVQSTGNLDLVAIGRLIGSLFKKKNKTPEIEYITTGNLITLFESNRLFNQTLLISELKIPQETQYLFFEYCSAQNINNALIKYNREIELLDYLIVFAKEFNALLESEMKD